MPADPTGRPIPEVDVASLGPAVGQPFPDIVLPDQDGNPIDLHQHRAGRSAVVVFHRSADW